MERATKAKIVKSSQEAVMTIMKKVESGVVPLDEVPEMLQVAANFATIGHFFLADLKD